MDIVKFSDFILNEARTNKKDVIDALVDMFKKKPNVEMNTLPNEKGIYSLAGMKKALSNFNSTAVGNALGELQGDKKSGLKVVRAYISVWDENVPYWYMDMTEAEAGKIAKEYEKEEAAKNKHILDKKASSKVTAKKRSTKKAEPKEGSETKGVERKAGAPKKRVTKSAKTKK